MKEKYLKGTDIILNLKSINICNINSFSSSSCGGSVHFNIECRTNHGYCEDPRFLGEIKVLEAKKCKEKGTYLLKVKFKKEEED